MALFQSKQKHVQQLMEELRQEQLQEEAEARARREEKWRQMQEESAKASQTPTSVETVNEDNSSEVISNTEDSATTVSELIPTKAIESVSDTISEIDLSENVDLPEKESTYTLDNTEEIELSENINNSIEVNIPDTDTYSEEPQEKDNFWTRLVKGLARTRDNFTSSLNSIFSGHSKIDEDFYEELEEILVMGDVGIKTTELIIDDLKDKVKENHIKDPMDCRELLISSIKEQMLVDDHAYDFEQKQSVVMVIGVNGVGKTTSVGKLAGIFKNNGRKVLIAAADTFRAAASDQLQTWAERAGVPMVRTSEGADPASVVFDACSAAKARDVDMLLIDTAGRLHNKKNLMEELRKMNRIIDREYPDAHRETFIVLDAATGQNALVQAKEFGDVTDLTGIILTKMDGTAKGGIAIAIQSELQVPVKYIGVGETIEDLQRFSAEDFVNALFETDNMDTDL